MITAMLIMSLAIQQPAPKTTTAQTQTSDRDMQNAAQDLRDAIRSQINAEAIKARAQAAAAKAAAHAEQGTPAVPTPPTTPRTFTIRGPDGSQTVIGVPPFGGRNEIPPQAVDVAISFFITIAVIIIGLPIARAFARRMDRRTTQGQVPPEISSQLTHLNQAVDAIALEVERISEGQRFTARLLSEQRDAARPTLSSGADR
jgi:hypothetical protein